MMIFYLLKHLFLCKAIWFHYLKHMTIGCMKMILYLRKFNNYQMYLLFLYVPQLIYTFFLCSQTILKSCIICIIQVYIKRLPFLPFVFSFLVYKMDNTFKKYLDDLLFQIHIDDKIVFISF